LNFGKCGLFLEICLYISAVLFLMFCVSTHSLEHKYLFLFTKHIAVDIKKVKYTLVQALRLCTGHTAHRGSKGIAIPFHVHGARRG
jgi:hypothetical protein